MAPAVMDGSDGEIVDEGIPILLVIQKLYHTGLACMPIMKIKFQGELSRAQVSLKHLHSVETHF